MTRSCFLGLVSFEERQESCLQLKVTSLNINVETFVFRDEKETFLTMVNDEKNPESILCDVYKEAG